MKLYEKYITKLFFSRFFVILFCVVLFVVFRELTGVSAILTSLQTAMITPLFIPFFIFQFLPFIYFGSLLMTMNELYSNNELVSFKATGVSYAYLIRVFLRIAFIVMLFLGVIIALYPAGLKQFYKQRNMFTATNLITQLKPKTINKIGANTIYFRRINSESDLIDFTLIQEEKNKKKIFFSKNVKLFYDDNDRLNARCSQVNINNITINDKTNKSSVYNVKMDIADIDIDEFLQTGKPTQITGSNRIKSMGLFSLIKNYINGDNFDVKYEFHSRCICMFLSIFAMTFCFCLLLLRQTNRIPNKKLLLTAIILGANFSIARAYELEGFLKANKVWLFYSQFAIASIGCLFYILQTKKIIRKKK